MEQEQKTAAFFYEDQFYPDIETFLEDLGWDEEYIKELPDDYVLKIKEAKLEPVIELSADWIFERIYEGRFSEDGNEGDKVYKILEDIDYKTINAAMPKLYYESTMKNVLNKKDLLDAIS
jgi:hypothetical protein